MSRIRQRIVLRRNDQQLSQHQPRSSFPVPPETLQAYALVQLLLLQIDL